MSWALSQKTLMNVLLALQLVSLALFFFVISWVERVLTKNVIDIYLDLDKAILLKLKFYFQCRPHFPLKILNISNSFLATTKI